MITLVMPTATQEYQATSASPTAAIATFQATTATTKIPASRHNKKTGQHKDGAELKAPRVGHKKSRKGCAQCKRRHVKCNEEAPCSNCNRHGVPCSLAGGPFVPREDSKKRQKDRTQSIASSSEATTAAPSLPSRSPLAAGSSLSLPIEHTFERSSISPFSPPHPHYSVGAQQLLAAGHDTFGRLTAHLPRSPGSTNWQLDLQLMHHYMSYTKGVLGEISDQAFIVHIWKNELPKIAFSHDHALNALLGLVALHKATVMLEQASSLRSCAIEHMDLAAMQLQRANEACTAEAASAHYVSRWLALLFGYAAATQSVGNASEPGAMLPPNALDGMADLMLLAGEVGSATHERWYLISQGPFAQIVTRGWQEAVATYPLLPEGLDLGLNHLDYMLGIEAMLPNERAACALAIDELRSLHQSLLPQSTSGCGVASLLCWPKQESATLSDMVRRRIPQALVIVSYHCVILNLLDGRWWARGWGERVLQDVLLNLNDGWKNWVQWPVQALMFRENVTTSAVVSSSPALDMGLGTMLL
ncbi:hypothetical protein CKM354_000660300 [Cercospora kikuchii]|uniref:Zn(2)-C6 fungal-type domain-containing protein n=1 Tax=Cercospora kikuchii TaxID=84275 RepID=A0A9P3CIH8_9PEZI|nr:uncharacterized protein CKM354_000660300 [Cercospora kikuchii]GIZ43373.1 hypothetical protein CKM354_000660300 [Cercospora kikuchii]